VDASLAKSFVDGLIWAVGMHRAWDRAPLVMASVVPPVGEGTTTRQRSGPT
jgi:catalase